MNRVAVVQAVFAAVGAGDAGAQLAHYTDDVVFELPYASPPKRIEGKAAALAFLSEAFERWRLSLSIDEVHEAADSVVVEFSGTGVVRATGAPYSNRYIAVFRFRDGLICAQREYYGPLG